MTKLEEFKATHKESDRMHLASLIERMANPKVPTFSPVDAQEVFDSLADLPLQPSQISVSATIPPKGNPSKDTGTGMSGPDDDERKFKKTFGRDISYRCGTYVLTRMAKNQLDIRHVADVEADSTANEVLRIVRKRNAVFVIKLNAPYYIKIPFLGRIVITNLFRDWKKSKKSGCTPENSC